MNINIKTLQVTLSEMAADANANKRSVVQAQINANQLQQVTVVELAGDLDTNTAPLVQAQILPLAKAGSKLILEMTKVLYMSSAGLRMLLSLYRQIASKDGQVILVGLSEEIKDTMYITGFLDFFQTCETLDQALKALNVKIRVMPT